MAYDTISATNLANWIPSVWSKDVLSAVEKSLVCGGLFDRSYEQWSKDGGDTIVVPNLAELSAKATNTAVDVTLYDAVQNVTNISLNKKYNVAVMIDDLNQIQTNPKYYDKVKSKAAYALAKVIDINCNELFQDFNNAVGTVNTAITDTDIMDAYEYLNEADAPFEDRAWVFDPASITDLMKYDFFTNMSYVPDSIHKTGFRGKQILGSPVYITTNLFGYAGGPHAAAYFQREAAALVVQMAPRFEVGRVPLRIADALIGVCLYGVQEMRGTFGVCINTRS